jgi:hypothetical protein
MNRDDEHEALPPPLRDGRGRTAALVRAYLREAAKDREPYYWARLSVRIGQARRDGAGARRRAVLLAGVASAAGAFVGLWLLVTPLGPAPEVERPGRVAEPTAGALGVSPGGLGQVRRPGFTPGAPTLVPVAQPMPAAPATPVVRAGRRAVALTVGASWLERDARVTLSPEARAEVVWGRDGARVALDVGRIALEVAPQPPGRRLEVSVPPYRFVVHGTRFEVLRGRGVVTLTVTEGAVSVHRGARRLATVSGGEKWSGALLPPPALQARIAAPAPASQEPEPLGHPAPPPWGVSITRAVSVADASVPGAGSAAPPSSSATGAPASAAGAPPPVADPVARPAPAVRALALRVVPAQPPVVRNGPAQVPAPPRLDDCRSSARPADALACYRRLSATDGLAAEVALHEAAVLCRDRLGDAERALALLREHRARFPAGALAREVSLSIVELLPRLGQHRQALDESTALLAAESDGARAAELHLLRGTAYREGLGDCVRAETEYALAARGRTAPAASFWRGVCLEQIGRFAEAAAAYRAVGNADARFAAQARARLEVLHREHRDQPGLQGR